MDYSKIAYTVLALLVAVAVVFFIPWLKAKVDKEQLNKFLTYVKLIVQAAEQIFCEDQNEQKKQYVVNAISEMGFKYSDDIIDNAIESAVLELNK